MIDKDELSDVRRRDLLRAAAAVSLSTMTGTLGANQSGKSSSTLVQRENARPGTIDWQLTRVRVPRDDGQLKYRCKEIEGYCSNQSVAAGQSIDIMVSTDPVRQFKLEIFRTGYYGSRGARLMRTIGPVQGKTQPTPPSSERRLRECHWQPSVTLKIPNDWPSGVYLGRLTTLLKRAEQPYWQSYIVFIVRDERPADILFQCADNTWQAYNRWPERDSLYDDGSARQWSSGPNVDVSFDRPYGRYRQIYENPQTLGSGEFLCWEYPLCFWLEQHGYDVTYCSNSDMIRPNRGLKCKTFISVGHDEYWDLRQYQSVRTMIDSGVNALFLCGNSICWVTPFSPNADGRPNRIITRAGPYGGFARAGELDDGPFPMQGPDEGLIMGARNVVPVNGGGDWIVARPDHWIFEGSGLKKGDAIPGLVGWEYHGNPASIPGLEVVAEGTAFVGGTRPQHWTATVYPGPRGNFVFNAATIFWSQGLSSPPGHMLPWSHGSRPHGPDPRVQRITYNLIKRGTRPQEEP